MNKKNTYHNRVGEGVVVRTPDPGAPVRYRQGVVEEEVPYCHSLFTRNGHCTVVFRLYI